MKTTKEKIIDIAYKLAKTLGLRKVSQLKLQEEYLKKHEKVLHSGTISYHFVSIENLKDEILQKAVKEKNYDIIIEGLMLELPYCKAIPSDIKKKAAKHFAKKI